MLKRIFIFFFLPLAIFADVRPAQEKNLVILLSFPRTGTNWACNSIQLLTGRRCYYVAKSLQRLYTGDGLNRLSAKLNRSKPPLIRSHIPQAICPLKKHGNKLILLSRNHRETVLRMGKMNSEGIFDNDLFEKIINDDPSVSIKISKYYPIYKFFDEWPKQSRLLVEFEDLVKNPVETMRSILAFIDEPETHLNDYRKNLEIYRSKSVESYDNQPVPKKWGGALSKGVDALFHSKQASKENLHKIDQFIRNKVGEDLWHKYFAKYAVDI